MCLWLDKLYGGNLMAQTKEISKAFLSPEVIDGRIEKLQEFEMLYASAIKEVRTKLEILDHEFKVKRKRNPIEYIKSRVKEARSIMGKLERKGLDLTIEAAKENLNDIAGIRVVCSFVSDIYELADMLKNQEDITLINEKDYIKKPKPNGYRSLHMILEVPIFFSDHVEPTRIEVQIRTIAMDFWASLEHKLYYKTIGQDSSHIKNELKECADIIAETDLRMQNIQKEVEKLN